MISKNISGGSEELNDGWGELRTEQDSQLKLPKNDLSIKVWSNLCKFKINNTLEVVEQCVETGCKENVVFVINLYYVLEEFGHILFGWILIKEKEWFDK